MRKRIEARRPWIVRQLREFETLPSLPPPRFVALAKAFCTLADSIDCESKRVGATLHCTPDAFAYACMRERASRVVRRALESWYGARAREVLVRRLKRLQSEVPLLATPVPQVRVRRMTRRWGSCTAHGVITLNPALVQAPPSCVDYVIAHQLVHLMEPGHTPRFFRLMTRAMPDWRDPQRRLAATSVRFL